MTTLTWRDVAAPDFRGVQEGYRNFSDMLGTAFSAAQKGLQAFDNEKTDAANNALLADVAAAQDGDAAKALLSSIRSRPGASRLSADAIKFAMARPGDLTKQAGAESDLSFTNYTRDRLKTKSAAMDAAAPVLAQAGLLANSGKMDEATKVLSDHADVLQGLAPDDFVKSIKDLQGVTQGDTSNRSSLFNYGTAVRDDGESRQAATLSGIIRRNGIEPADFDAYVTQHYDEFVKQGISPVVIEKARHAVLSDPTAAASFYENGSLGGGSAGGGGAVGNPLTVANYEARAAGISGIPDGTQNLGQWSNWASAVNSKGVKSSAAGIFQITGDTLREFAPKVFGSNWQNAAFSGDSQDKLGRAIFESTKGDPRALMARWPSLSPAQAQKIAGLPWEQVRDTIAQGESGVSNVQALIAQDAQDNVAVIGPRYNRSQDSGQTFARGMLDAMGSDADVRTVAAGLAGKDGVLAGENIGNVSGVIKQISETYHVSPAAAGLILKKSVDQNKNWYQRAGDSLKGFFGGGDGLASHIDWDAVDQFGKLAGNRDALLKQATASRISDASSMIAASAAQTAAATQAQVRARAQAAARLGRNVDPSFALTQAAQAADTRTQALDNSAAVTIAGGRQPDQAPTIDRHNIPQSTPASAPAPAQRAQAFLERKFQEMIPSKAGPVQLQGVKEQFKRQFGVSIEQVRSNPNLAWEAAKRLDNRAAQLIQNRAANNNAYFAR